ncbi:MAG: hypothetical protein JNM68_07210 [Dinghuibacter sp.]|nr:hypothetical protein [Dinghuibacter sp.]
MKKQNHVRKISLKKQTVQLLGNSQQQKAAGGTGTCYTIDCSLVCSYVTLCWWCNAQRGGGNKPQ